ncbi:MAG: hypothetical protein K8U57_07555 [Planctomycetes bacterium]|nr:hypothetical protein [Planctomycetota bacterium]
MINPTQDTMAMLKASLGQPLQGDLQKGVTVATGLTYYDLQAPAKNLYPVITPLRNKIPRVRRPNSGNATNWKQVSSLVGSGYNAMGWVPEGQRSGTMSYVTANKAATYVTIGEEDFLTFEAEAAAQGFEDENAMVTFRLLQKMMQKEEMAILGGNASLSLSAPSTPTLSASGSGATLPGATYSVIAVALTFEGFKNSSLTGGVATSQTVTGADGKTYALSGGSSNKSGNATQAVSLGQALLASVPSIQGAVAYAWYVGTAGSEKLEAITTINSVSFSKPLLGTGQAATAVTANNSANANLAFDGLLTQALNPSNLAYVNLLPTGTAGTGTTLTASGRGTVVEIDNMLQSMWDNYRISPTVLYVNSQELKNMTNKCLSNTSGPLLHINQSANGPNYELTAGGVIGWYFNPFTMNGGSKIPVLIHPDLPPGTIIAWAEQLPAWYQSNEVPNVAEIICRRDYYRMDWPLRTRQREYGVYAEEVLACYATFAMGVIGNVANG